MVDERLGVPGTRRGGLAQPVEALVEHLPAPLDQAVGVEEHERALRELRDALAVARGQARPEREAAPVVEEAAPAAEAEPELIKKGKEAPAEEGEAKKAEPKKPEPKKPEAKKA